MNFWAKCRVTCDGVEWMDDPLDCYDYLSTCGANKWNRQETLQWFNAEKATFISKLFLIGHSNFTVTSMMDAVFGTLLIKILYNCFTLQDHKSHRESDFEGHRWFQGRYSGTVWEIFPHCDTWRISLECFTESLMRILKWVKNDFILLVKNWDLKLYDGNYKT